MTSSFPRAVAAVAVILLPAAALAHAKMLSATPAANATVAAPEKVELRFSEKLVPTLSALTLMTTGTIGKPHPVMPLRNVASSVGADGKTLTLISARPLPAGTYRVDWHVVSTDTHRVAGTYSFMVR